ncbi:MAG: arsenate reductase (glutaredoxin) [Caulobacter sp.]|nr:arsenate reductase (glutaredoxin) [Caulobacter sp.]
MTVTIFHNRACGTSRNTLAAIRETGVEPTVVEYLKTGWTRAQLRDLLGKLGLGPRDILRIKGTPAADLGLTDPAVGDDAILDAMVAHPILVERPIVVAPRGAVLSRPSERVFEILDNAPAAFVKEDGERVLPGNAPDA